MVTTHASDAGRFISWSPTAIIPSAETRWAASRSEASVSDSEVRYKSSNLEGLQYAK
jgi:hypothetical protein